MLNILENVFKFNEMFVYISDTRPLLFPQKSISNHLVSLLKALYWQLKLSQVHPLI